MKKKIQSFIKLQVKAGQANPSPPIGPALGQKGINIMSFCKSFNEQTKDMVAGSPVPVIITVYSDKSFSFITKTLPTSFLIRKKINIAKGSAESTKTIVGTINRKQLEEIAKEKTPDLTANDMDAAVKTIAGTASSMGIKVVT